MPKTATFNTTVGSFTAEIYTETMPVTGFTTFILYFDLYD